MMVEIDALYGEAIQIGCQNFTVAIRPQGIVALLIRVENQDVRAFHVTPALPELAGHWPARQCRWQCLPG